MALLWALRALLVALLATRGGRAAFTFWHDSSCSEVSRDTLPDTLKCQVTRHAGFLGVPGLLMRDCCISGGMSLDEISTGGTADDWKTECSGRDFRATSHCGDDTEPRIFFAGTCTHLYSYGQDQTQVYAKFDGTCGSVLVYNGPWQWWQIIGAVVGLPCLLCCCGIVLLRVAVEPSGSGGGGSYVSLPTDHDDFLRQQDAQNRESHRRRNDEDARLADRQAADRQHLADRMARGRQIAQENQRRQAAERVAQRQREIATAWQKQQAQRWGH